MVTKYATEFTVEKVVPPLFFGVGEKLVSFSEVQAKEIKLGFERESIAKTLPEEYIPRVGSFERQIPEVNVRGLMAWREWPTTRELIEQQKLLPFVTQTQLTRVGITPYVPDITVEATSKGMAQIFGAFAVATLPKTLPQMVAMPKVETVPKLEPAIKVKQPTFEEPFEVQKLKLFPQVYARERQEAKVTVTPQLVKATKIREQVLSVPKLELSQIQRLRPILAFGISTRVIAIPKLEEMTVPILKVEAVSIMGVTTAQETKQLQRQVQLQIQKQIPQFQIPKTMQVPKTWFEDSYKLKRYKPKAKDFFGLWGRYPRVYPLATPKQVLEMFTAKRRKRK